MIRINLLGSEEPRTRSPALFGRRELFLGTALLIVAAAILYQRPLLRPIPRREPAAPPIAKVAAPVQPAEVPKESPAAEPFHINAISIRREPDALIILVHVKPDARYRVSQERAPARLVIDFPNTRLLAPPGQLNQPVDHSQVRRVRAGQPEPDATRIVLDLESAVSHRIAPAAGGIEIRVPDNP